MQSERLPSSQQITTNAGEDADERNTYALLVGKQISAISMEINMEVPQETKNRTI
jgi:hypothetical protein